MVLEGEDKSDCKARIGEGGTLKVCVVYIWVWRKIRIVYAKKKLKNAWHRKKSKRLNLCIWDDEKVV